MWQHRRLLIGIVMAFILSLIVIYQYGYSYLRNNMEIIQEERELKLRTIQKYKNVLASSEGIEEELTELKKALQEEELRLIPGETPALASANLQERIKRLITSNGGRIRSERMGKTKEYGHYREISVSLDAEFDSIESLSNVLYSIEAGTPFMVIRELNIRVRNYRNPGSLIVRLRISGLSR
jgi:general secretion pathway protein M